MEYNEVKKTLPEIMEIQSNLLNLKFVLQSSYIMTYQIAITQISNIELVQYIYNISKFLQNVSDKWKNEIEKRAQIFMPGILYKLIHLS